MAQTTFTVNSDGDSSNQTAGDGNCDTGGSVNGDPECTLRAAIEEANSESGDVTIEFWDEFTNVTTIQPESSYEILSNDNVTIAGDTHPASNDYPGVLIDGDDLATNASGIRIGSQADNTTIRQIAVGRFNNSGIWINGADAVEIHDSQIGVHSVFNLGNEEHGIHIQNASESTVIQNSRITDNDEHGIYIEDDVSSTIISLNNEIGIAETITDISATGNGGYGVYISSSAGENNSIGFCLFGCSGNTIAANSEGGIYLAADGQNVVANLIGTDPDGSDDADFGNEGHGILVESSDNSMGTNDDDSGNTIAHNDEDGINFPDNSTDNNEVINNYIGTNADGEDLGNEGEGIQSRGDIIIEDNSIKFNNLNAIRQSAGDITVLGNIIMDNSAMGSG